MKNKNLKDILIIFILFFAIAAIIIPKPVNNLDELWNYNFARNIADGLLPYKDFNMIQMPLLPILCSTVLKLTFNELIIMRILASILIAAILYVTYKIFKVLKIHQYICLLFMILIYLLMYEHFCIDYNFTTLLIILITIYFELKNILKNEENLAVNKKDFLLGALVGTSILFKQTTGLFTSVIFMFYKLLIVCKKEDFKKIVKIIFIRMVGVLLPVILFVIYLSINNIWKDFLDYTILSLNTFSNKISYINLINGNYGVIIAILSILLPFTIIAMYVICICKNIQTYEQKNILILFAYSVAAFVVLYPISDSIHFLIGGYPTLLAFGYISSLIIKKVSQQIQNKKLIYGLKGFIQGIVVVITVMILILSAVSFIKYFCSCGKYNELKHFKYIPSSSERIEKIDEFILEQNTRGKEVYILDATAAIYMIPIDKYNKDYDMFLKGNIGAKGEEGQIKKLEKATNTVVLIMNENYKRNWQNPEEVREYIINNWNKMGQIMNFDVYQSIN